MFRTAPSFQVSADEAHRKATRRLGIHQIQSSTIHRDGEPAHGALSHSPTMHLAPRKQALEDHPECLKRHPPGNCPYTDHGHCPWFDWHRAQPRWHHLEPNITVHSLSVFPGSGVNCEGSTLAPTPREQWLNSMNSSWECLEYEQQDVN